MEYSKDPHVSDWYVTNKTSIISSPLTLVKKNTNLLKVYKTF